MSKKDDSNVNNTNNDKVEDQKSDQERLSNDAKSENEDAMRQVDPNGNKDAKQRVDTLEDESEPEVEIDKSAIQVTKNDQEWADENCIYILDKYVNHVDPSELVDIDKHLFNIMKDLHVHFDIPESREIYEDAISRLEGNTTRSAEFFLAEMYKYIKSYRELKNKVLQDEGLMVVNKVFDKRKLEIQQFYEAKKQENQDYFKTENTAQILNDFMDLVSLRLVCLDYARPKDNSSIVTETQEAEFAEMIKTLFSVNKLTEITSMSYLLSILRGYLKSSNIKYSFVYVPKYDEADGLDPYADHGEVAPGEEGVVSNANNEEGAIDQEIEKAEQANLGQKVQLLKKIKNLKQLKQYAGRVSEEESIDMMINNTYKQIQNISEIPDESEGEGEFYEGEGDNDFNSQRRKSQSHVSRKGETLEARREKGL